MKFMRKGFEVGFCGGVLNPLVFPLGHQGGGMGMG